MRSRINRSCKDLLKDKGKKRCCGSKQHERIRNETKRNETKRNETKRLSLVSHWPSGETLFVVAPCLRMGGPHEKRNGGGGGGGGDGDGGGGGIDGGGGEQVVGRCR
ncbi:hypothetical protein HZH68_001615 [Vespula germanica]|uniref:Uncharacterized protein n=1 Tax=Vespula germanica TaxID=30212 RepID=A0A834NW08_VESGE|nr:hypothetical protein HZH68_001615 [Vespula germanica]